MGLFTKRCQTIDPRPLETWLDHEEELDDLDSGIHEVSWLIDLGSEPVESDINTA